MYEFQQWNSQWIWWLDFSQLSFYSFPDSSNNLIFLESDEEDDEIDQEFKSLSLQQLNNPDDTNDDEVEDFDGSSDEEGKTIFHSCIRDKNASSVGH